MVVKTDKISS
nr:leader 2 (gtg start codon) [synthetic construct]